MTLLVWTLLVGPVIGLISSVYIQGALGASLDEVGVRAPASLLDYRVHL
jgi:hypothetical protein